MRSEWKGGHKLTTSAEEAVAWHCKEKVGCWECHAMMGTAGEQARLGWQTVKPAGLMSTDENSGMPRCGGKWLRRAASGQWALTVPGGQAEVAGAWVALLVCASADPTAGRPPPRAHKAASTWGMGKFDAF